VDDIESEWLDRYGPLPDPARALLGIAHLRAECARLGIREVAVVRSNGGLAGGGYTARLSPLELKTSQKVRLTRIAPKAVYKEEIGQLVLTLPKSTDPAEHLTVLLGELAPPVASAAS
jgi:transcription-repair coupling factor (superfamily II helicase)